jgi:hypothetical protein
VGLTSQAHAIKHDISTLYGITAQPIIHPVSRQSVNRGS